MSIKDFHTTTTWLYLGIVCSILSVVVHCILLVIESASFYHRIGGCKKTSPNNTDRFDRAQSASASEEVESQEDTTTNIDISMPSRSTSAKSKPSSDKPKRTVWRLHILPLFMYSFYIMTNIISVLFKLGIGSFSDCKPCGIKGSLFALGKLMMYLIFIYRLHAIYSNTALQYNTKHLSMMAVICVLYQCGANVVNLFSVSSVSVQIGDETYCGCVYVMIIPAIILFADTIVSIICCCAFIKPLKALEALIPESIDPDLHRAVVKNMTLTCVAVITTMFIMIVIIALKLNELAAIDMIINSLCVFLMNKERDLWFKYLCFDGKCGSKAVECCCSADEAKK